ncbi:growth-regulated alpha protein-like [Centropristis striata]|uniref:growth-regulated alpha protein-like n=1 Tax=Centropristis striata TaxID=184440 RepID=UPI0027E0B9B0|nr:growth-regulated alpha protein-like [Centropristis striata]XP_059211201.1 growth-regulated alpha protein-like [Centropristis striata]
MNPAIQCIILLACAVICTSASKCRCAATVKGVKPSLIADVEEYKPRPYCNKREVIIKLKDNSMRCLDPKEKFTQAVLRTILVQRVKAQMNSSSLNAAATTVSATVSATVMPTSS